MEIIRSLYSTVYCQAHSQANGLLLAGNNEGKILVYNIECLLEREEGGGVSGERPEGPSVAVNASLHPVYSMVSSPAFAITGSSGSLAGWRWSDLKELDEAVSPAWTIALQGDQSNFGTPEINGLSYNAESNLIWAACGDWKARGYDMETGRLISTLDAHKDYVHQVAVSGSSGVVSCGEDGAVLVWDCRAPRVPVMTIVPSQQTSLARPNLGKFVRCVDTAGGEWLVCGGGPSAGVFHLRSGGLVATLPPSDALTPVTVAQFTRQDQASSIVTAGCDGGGVSVCSLSGQVTAQLPAVARCVYSVAASFDKHTLMSVAGTGSRIDICLNLSYRDHSLSTVLD
ncbi:THO complex subunit 6 homolog [Hyalella azteca]|uniref:THO complex subunit 6 homolog n=1 Tax=Hyalella azteca TaxID=294128 RepID=A0A8B7NTD9_HYAAZ|nr:THO complex subunit 6 homolog [Hyalella azteca]